MEHSTTVRHNVHPIRACECLRPAVACVTMRTELRDSVTYWCQTHLDDLHLDRMSDLLTRGVRPEVAARRGITVTAVGV